MPNELNFFPVVYKSRLDQDHFHIRSFFSSTCYALWIKKIPMLNGKLYLITEERKNCLKKLKLQEGLKFIFYSFQKKLGSYKEKNCPIINLPGLTDIKHIHL